MPTSVNTKQSTAKTARKASTEHSDKRRNDCGASKTRQSRDLSGTIIISSAAMEIFEDFAKTYEKFDYEHAIRSTG